MAKQRQNALGRLNPWSYRVVRRRWWVPVVLFGVLGALYLLMGPVTYWAAGSEVTRGLADSSGGGLTAAERITATKERAAAINAARQTVLQAVGGTAALSALVFTATNFLLNRRGQFTERYSKAVEQLASEQMTSRIGGVYALEHVMRESVQDHETVVEVLAAFVREKAPWSPIGPKRVEELPVASESEGPGMDVLAALTVVGRRPRRDEVNPVDLSSADLRDASFRGAHLEHAILLGANLTDANLEGANLTHANLLGANLTDAILLGANLTDAILEVANLLTADLGGANLLGANLEGADLRGANLEGAKLMGVNLEGADLRGAILEGANLTDAVLTDADLEGAGLRDAGLRDADLRGANLAGAYLVGADLRGANLEVAKLLGANLAGAYLVGAKLLGADLEGANLEGADLRGAHLGGAEIASVELTKTGLKAVHCLPDSTCEGI